MKVDASRIAPARLADHLRARYGLDAVEIVFLPKGEDAYGYAVTAAGGRRFWVRLQPPGRGRALVRALAVLSRLRGPAELEAAVRPNPTRWGAATSVLGDHVVALFPFVEGATADERPADDEQIEAVARTIAALHGSAIPGALRRVRLRDPYGRTIRALLAAAGRPPGRTDGRHAGEARRLLDAHRGGVLDALAVADRLGDDGGVRLVDWGGMCVGPREWDLAHFGGDRLDLFLGAYLGAAGPLRLAEEAFLYHGYRWALQEIADYAGRLLEGAAETEEAEHALRELRAHLPPPVGSITAEAERAVAALRAARASGSRRPARAVEARQGAATDDLVLLTERLVLRDFDEGDLVHLHALRSDPEVARFMDFRPESLEDARAWLDGVIRHKRTRPRAAYNLAIALPDGRAIGWIGFGRSSRDPAGAGEYGVGYMLAREHWGRGYASEALRAAIAFMVDRLGARRVSAWCWAENRASARVMEKAGMRFVRRSEGTEPKSGVPTPRLEYAASAEQGARGGPAGHPSEHASSGDGHRGAGSPYRRRGA